MSAKLMIQLAVAVGALIVFVVLSLATGNRLESAAIAIGGGLIVTAVLTKWNQDQPAP